MADLGLLKFIGLSDKKAEETIKNKNLTKLLIEIIQIAQTHIGKDTCNKSIGLLLYHLGTKLKLQLKPYLNVLICYICEQKFVSELQLSTALDYLLSNLPDVNSLTKSEDKLKFEKTCGVGVVVSKKEISKLVTEIIDLNKTTLLNEAYNFNVGKLLGDLRRKSKWADGKLIKEELDAQLLVLLGPKNAAKNVQKEKKKPSEKKEASDTTASTSESDDVNVMNFVDGNEILGFRQFLKRSLNLHEIGENYKTDGYVVTENTKSLLKSHLERTKGKVMTRFPPEPNGILHIGHAKAINFNFAYAAANNGLCYLRYDDTNPEKEEEKFFTLIREMVEWLGYKPYRVTHSSDYFPELYNWAEELILKNQAYVCHQKVEEIRGQNPLPSPWRDRPKEESLYLFRAMRDGRIDESEATLRLKLTLEDGKVDPVAYRIKFTPHHRSGNTWCIYPTYDYTHCLCDSIEDISHSLCTKEFQSRRSSYYWLCNALNLYCPVQWEYSRLNLYYTVVSKRKIGRLISEKIVSDWDDPRLFTLTALKRRGVPPAAINYFVAKVGLTTAQSILDPSLLDACIRDVLNITAPRIMAIADPLEIHLENFAEVFGESIQDYKVEVPNFPIDPSKGLKTVPLTSTVYIDRSDFREEADKDYKRLSLKQTVGLRYVNLVLTVLSVKKDANNEIVRLNVNCQKAESTTKPKGFIQWISKPVPCEFRLYGRLFIHKTPEDKAVVPGGFLTDCDKNSLEIKSNAMIDERIKGANVMDTFQFERMGYFALDQDTTPDKFVFNRTVTLREDVNKN